VRVIVYHYNSVLYDLDGYGEHLFWGEVNFVIISKLLLESDVNVAIDV
jgi:hypothetical protein